MDLANYRYFKYPQNGQKSARLRMPESTAEYHLKRARAVFNYAGSVLFGSKYQRQVSRYVFDPEFGLKWRGAFNRQFGYRGENLIALLGSGRSKQELMYYGAIGRNVR